MKMKKMKPASPRRHRSVLVVLLLVAGVAMGTYVFRRPAVTRPAPVVAVRSLDWHIVDYLLSQRTNFLKDIGSDGLPEWRDFTPAYFAALKARKDAVIAWTAARPTPTPITFIGLVHISLNVIPPL